MPDPEQRPAASSRGVTILIILAVLAAAGSSGFLVSQAVGGSAQTPTKTVTVNVGTGPQGPPGPAGPPGPTGAPGAESCPSGSEFGKLVLNAPGGQVSILTCIVD
jgi:hypothetical protein